MKYTLTLLLIYINTLTIAQDRFKISEASIDFASDAPLELIEASSSKLKGVIDPLSNRIAFSVKTESFEGFNSELQRQHFNENYLESSKFPKASFSGKIIEQVDYNKEGIYNVRAKGDLNIHGQKQTRIIKGKLKIGKDGKISLTSSFTVPLEEHDITIPKIVYQKIATEIVVTIKAKLKSEDI